MRMPVQARVGRRGLAKALVLAAIALAALGVWLVSEQTGRQRALAALDEELAVLARTVEIEIERFRSLPAVVARDSRIRDVLVREAADDVAAANAYLQQVRADTSADELYVMRLDGQTVAASNHAEPTSFVGQNYRFRPYFEDAVRTGTGRYYAVGATTGIPGYFLSSAVREGGRIVGVAIVKVDMGGLEQAWASGRTLLGLADEHGVIFLTGHAPWKYRPLHPLDEAALARIAATRKYDGVDLAAAAPLFEAAHELPQTARMDGEDTRHLVRQVRIEPDGWRLVAMTGLGPIHANSALLTMLAALAGLLAAGAALYMHQRRQLVRAKLEAHDALERRVEARTAELNREIEERRRAEADLRKAQSSLIHAAKLAALGRMSAAIVHEVSQPLSAMENTLATAGLLAERGETQAVPEKVRAARELVRRIQRTVKLLRSFARNEPVAPEPVEIGRSVAVAMELAAHRAAAEGVAISFDPPPQALFVRANATRLEQVVLNLVINALDAVSGREQPHVSLACEQAGGEIRILVRDNGPGIPEHLRERIAEPFFSTKLTGEGLGLGLSISRAIVDEFDGRIFFERNDEGGCTFTVALPALEGASVRAAAE